MTSASAHAIINPQIAISRLFTHLIYIVKILTTF